MKICVYTCITGGYDTLKTPKVISKNIDYICFSDKPINSTIWKYRPIPNDLLSLSKVKQQRIIKICPHKYLKEYDISVWIDGNITIIGDINEFISEYDLNKFSFYARKHPYRDCIYDELDACIKFKKGDTIQFKKQIQKYKNDNYPAHNGLIESGLLLRKHNNFNCQRIMNYWAIELLNESHRDQLSFNYICWKYNFQYGILEYQKDLRNNKFFEITHNQTHS